MIYLALNFLESYSFFVIHTFYFLDWTLLFWIQYLKKFWAVLKSIHTKKILNLLNLSHNLIVLVNWGFFLSYLPFIWCMYGAFKFLDKFKYTFSKTPLFSMSKQEFIFQTSFVNLISEKTHKVNWSDLEGI